MGDYHHHNAAFQPALARPPTQQYPNNYTTTAQATAGAQRPVTSTSRQSISQTSQYYDAPSSSQNMSSSRKRQRDTRVDWESYFGGKPPKEIIVIDDDSPVPQSKASLPQVTAGSSATMPSTVGPASTSTMNATSRHTDKRRRVDTSTTYNPVYHDHTAYSNTQTPYFDDASRHYSGSTDNTASYNNTTAPTSLGSSSSGTYLDDASVGQKRKRSTRQAVAEVKQRDIQYHISDPFAEYVPPPRPPIKAKDVHVQIVADVSTPLCYPIADQSLTDHCLAKHKS